MKSIVASLLLGSLLVASSAARADDVTQRRSWFGADFEFLPSGNIDGSFATSIGTLSGSAATDTAFGVGVVAENQVNDLISVGLAPRYIFNVIAKNDNGSASSELDLRARVAAGHDLIPKLRLYGFADPGYSIIFPGSNNNNNNPPHPNGFVLALGGGLGIAIGPKLRGTFELGYQWGFQTWSSGNFNGDYKTSYLELGFGIAVALD